MNRDDLRVGISAGLLGAMATAGALVAIGSRAATVARPFNAIAGHLLGAQRSDAFGFVASITITGVAVHFVLMTIAGIAVAMLTRRAIMKAWVASLVVATLAALVSIGIARRGGSSLARVLPIGDLIIFYVIVAASLAMGTRFAFLGRRAFIDSDRSM